MEKEITYACRYCGKEVPSFNCTCEQSEKNSHIWKAKKKLKEKKVKKSKN